MDKSTNELNLKIKIKNIDNEIEKAEKLVEILQEAKSLAEELASIDFNISINQT